MDELVAFVRAALDRDEQVAQEASRFDHGERPLTPTGEHWHWVEGENDRVIPIDPATDEFVGESLDEFRVSLRSVEQYPTDSSWPLPHFVIPTAEEVPAICGVHIARWDPARVLAEVQTKRRILDVALAEDHYLNDREWYGCRAVTENPEIDGPGVPTGQPCTCGRDERIERTARLLAQPYAGQDGWREEWAA